MKYEEVPTNLVNRNEINKLFCKKICFDFCKILLVIKLITIYIIVTHLIWDYLFGLKTEDDYFIYYTIILLCSPFAITGCVLFGNYLKRNYKESEKEVKKKANKVMNEV